MSAVGCDPGAIPWVEAFFGDCIYDFRDGASFFLGLASILIWTVAQMPQVIANVRNQSAEGLSIWFLLQWLCGDTLNLLGCLLQGSQLITTTLLAVYFVSSDFLLLSQYYYYEIFLPSRPSRHEDKPHAHIPALPESPEPHVRLLDVPPRRKRLDMAMTLDGPSLLAATAAPAATPFGQPEHQAAPAPAAAGGMPSSNLPLVVSAAAGASVLGLAAWGLTSAHGLGPGSGSFSAAPRYPPYFHTFSADAAFVGGMPGCNVNSSSSSSGSGVDFRDGDPWWCDPGAVKSLIGTIMGYSMTIFYLGSRFPQIYLNWLRKSSEGLCLSMFLLAGTANICTALSILLRSRTLEALSAQLPWLVGAVGTIGLDLFILYQGWLYQASQLQGGPAEEVGELEAPLLMEEGALMAPFPAPAPAPGSTPSCKSLNAHLVAEALLTGHHRPLPLATLASAPSAPSPPLSPRTCPASSRPFPAAAAIPMSPRFPIFVRTSTPNPRGSCDGDPPAGLSRGHSFHTAPQSPKESWVRSSSMGHGSVPASPSPAWSTSLPGKRPARLGQPSLMHHAEEEEGRGSSRCSHSSSQVDLRHQEEPKPPTP